MKTTLFFRTTLKCMCRSISEVILWVKKSISESSKRGTKKLFSQGTDINKRKESTLRGILLLLFCIISFFHTWANADQALRSAVV